LLIGLKKFKVFQLASIEAIKPLTHSMKTSPFSLALVIAVLGLTGCSETPSDKPAVGSAPAPTPAAVQGATEAAQKATAAASAAVSDAAAAVSAKFQEVLAQAQALLGQGKFPEAQDALKSLADMKLSADQQKLVDDLKAKIQQAMAAAKAGGGDAVKSVQGLLPKTK
jgi:hypothetical protein